MTMDLFTNPTFHGSDYEPKHDKARLTSQIKVIFDLMKDAKFRTLGEISELTGYGESSISAQLRNLRKPQNGGHTVNKMVIGSREIGLYSYQLIINTK